MLEYIFELIAPHLCLKCGTEGSILCRECADLLPPAPAVCYRCGKRAARRVCRSCARNTSFDRLVVVTGYQAEAKQLIHSLKFERAAAAAKVVAGLMAAQLTSLPENTVVTYVPTATGRVRARGYDQSGLVARHLAKRLNTPYRSLLARHGQTRQLGTDRLQRKKQMQRAFSMRGRLPEQTHIILVDDVVTTGSTLEDAAGVLKQAGARTVTAMVFAAA